MTSASLVAFHQYYSFLKPYVDLPNVQEVMVNEPGLVFVERDGVMEEFTDSEITAERMKLLAQQAILFTNQPQLTEKYPMVGGTLPTGERAQFVLPSATDPHRVIVCLRKQKILDLSIDQLEKEGAFDDTRQTTVLEESYNEHLVRLYKEGKRSAFLKAAVKEKLNILISGGTGTGKTAQLKAYLKELPLTTRLIMIEDATRELFLPHKNVVPLLYSRGGEKSGYHTAFDLMQVLLRLRPDRIVMGELRGSEAYEFLQAANSGHPGVFATIHANSPYGAMRRLADLVQLSASYTYEQALRYVESIINVIVHLEVHPTRHGVRYKIGEIYFDQVSRRS